MIYLPHGCWISDPTVNPKNWKKVGASTAKDWYIQYYFYDPSLRNDPKFKKHWKLCIVKGMNKFKSLGDRRQACQQLIDDEIQFLREEGFNPITNKFIHVDIIESDIDPKTSFIKALKIAKSSLTCARSTKGDLKTVLTYAEQEAIKLNYDKLPIIEIRKKHIKTILLRLSRSRTVWNASQFNYYRKYLGMLFKELMEYIDLEYNPALEVTKQKMVKRIRKTLTLAERKKIDEALKESNYYFWRFMHIFFHSGARETEMMNVRKQDVDLVVGKFKATIMKGKQQYETWKPIKDLALPLWKEVMSETNDGQYLFSRKFRPGNRSMHSNVISRWWKEKVKKGMGIEADFYSLKHSNLDEIAAALSIEDASKAASHTTPVITMDYAVGEKERQLNRVKKVNNTFS